MIGVVGSSKDKFLKTTDSYRKIFLIDKPHEKQEMNPWYCELTALYNIWKTNTDEIVGLEHYRRYFVNAQGKPLTDDEIKSKLENHDIILRRFIYNRYGLRDGFSWLESENKMKYLIEFLYEIKEPEFAMFVLHELETQPEMSQCNMFIGKKEVVDKYCEWVFTKLEHVDFEKFKDSPRIFGFLTEFVFLAWLKFYKYNVGFNRTITFDKDLTRVIEVTPE